MDWLNYHHLLYFWVVAREGSISRALRSVAPREPTISSQIRKLEESIGQKLFDRIGPEPRADRHGSACLSLRGRDLLSGTGNGGRDQRPAHRADTPPDRWGAEVIPKLIVHRLLQPALALDEPVQLVCREGKMEQLLPQLASHDLDLVLSDSPIGSLTHIRAFNHSLGSCAGRDLCRKQPGKAASSWFSGYARTRTDVLPTSNTWLRRTIDRWFDDHDIRPQIAAEIEDCTIKVFRQDGSGLSPGPAAIEKEICRQYR